MFKSLRVGGEGEMKTYEHVAFSLLSLIYTPLKLQVRCDFVTPNLGIRIHSELWLVWLSG